MSLDDLIGKLEEILGEDSLELEDINFDYNQAHEILGQAKVKAENLLKKHSPQK